MHTLKICTLLFFWQWFGNSHAVPSIEMNRRKAVDGLGLTITCISDVAITTTVLFFTKPAVTKGACLPSGTCGSSEPRYTVTQNRAQRTTTLTISSVNSSEDSGTWFCRQEEGEGDSGDLVITQFASVLDWSSVTYSPSLTSLPSSVTPQDTITVTVITPCITPAASITWRYQQGVSGSPPSSTSSSQGSCPSGQVQTVNTLSLPGNTASLYNRQISLTVSVEHDSFDPPTYTRSLTSNNVQFPVPVTSVTMQEISTDNQKVGQREGTSLTLTCVTSASFPTSTVTWSSLPLGTTPSTRKETTSGVLVKTTSSVTFSLRRSDQDRTLRCEAANINGQTSPPSNRAVLEVWFGPDSNQVRVTKTPDVVAVEGRDLTLTCSTLTPVSPGVTFTWEYSDGSSISGGSTGSVTGSAGNTWSQTLTFQPIRSKTSIRCRVRNTRTSESETGTLTLNVKWSPSGHPSIQDFSSPMYSGDRKTIRCRVTGGNPLADITWSCHNTNNTGINSTSGDSKISSLTFMVTKQQNSQRCQCSATWMYGGYDQTDTETFNVYYPPDTPTLTDPGTLCEGKSTSMTCSSADPGNPPASYYWTKNMASVHTGNTYTFTPGRDDHQAEIRCSAGNAHTDRAGHTRPKSVVRQLNVYYSPVITVVPGQNLTRKEGQSLSLICSADSNPGNTVLSWTFSGQSLTEASLQKTNLSRSDDGVYTCRGRVNTGSMCPGGTLQRHKDVTVTVNYAPDISFNAVDITEGQSLTLKCEANGRPQTYNFNSFTQYWGDTDVDSRTGSQTGATYKWITDDASYLDTGVYECSVNNGVTDRHDVLLQKKKVSVNVRASPKFTSDFPQVTAAEIGSTVNLSQTFYNSNLNYTSVNWTFAGTPVVSNTSVSRSQVTLRKNDKAVLFEGYITSATFRFLEMDIGVYTVTACNTIGCSSANVNLIAAGPPQTPTNFKTLNNVTKTSIWLSWKPSFPGGPYNQTFHVEYRQLGGTWREFASFNDKVRSETMVVEVNSLSPGTVYEFRMYAKNSRDFNNRSNYTDIRQGETVEGRTLLKQDSSSITGAVVGIVLGILALVAAGVGVTILYKRGYTCRCFIAKKADNLGTTPAVPEEDRPYESVVPTTEDNVTYATLEKKDSQDYTALRLYENTKQNDTKDQNFTATTNQDSTKPYQNMSMHTYANSKPKHDNAAYANTRFK